MAFTPDQSCSVSESLSVERKPSIKSTGLLLTLQETQSEACRWSASNSTATPSETASSHGESSPRQAESLELDTTYPVQVRAKTESVQTKGLTRLAGPEMDDVQLGDMFEDSDGEACPFSPSKSARRRLRRKRQRDAIKAAMRDMQQLEELEVRALRREDSQDHTSDRSIVTLAEIGFELDGCNATAEGTSQATLVTTPMQNAPRTAGVLSTSPCSKSPASAASLSMFRTVPLSDASRRHSLPTSPQKPTLLSDASNRHLPPMLTQSNSRDQAQLIASPCASNRLAPCPTLTLPSATMTSNVTSTQLVTSGLVASPPCSPAMYTVAATMSAPAGVEPLSANPERRRTADTLCMLLGISTLTSGGDIVATLEAAAPEVYED